MNGRLTITEVAKHVGVTPRTIMRWEKSGKIKRSKRDWRGWRFYLKEDLEGIKQFYESIYEYDAAERAAINGEKTASMVAGALLVFILAGLIAVPSFAAAQSVGSNTGTAQNPKSEAVVETKSTIDINLSQLPAMGTPPSQTMEEASKYTLGPDDVIEIEVRRHPEFSGKYTVTSEGKIEYKFVGDIIVTDLTKAQLQERLTGILAEYIIDPDVNIQIMAYMSKVFYVVGEVNRPGKFYMKGNFIKVREALVQAGLPTMSAATRKCKLITPNSKGKNNSSYVNVYELLYAGRLDEDVDMKPGDVLYVPSTVIAKIIRVISPVTNATAEAAGAAASGAALAL